jgi:excisionase family DNA binding protein
MNYLLGAKMVGKCLAVIEIAEMMKVSRGTVIRWIKTGRLRVFKLGGGRLWRIQEKDLKRFIK